MDGNDDNCRVHYRDYYEPEKIHVCECKCHEGQEKPKLPAPHEAPRDPKAPRGKAVKK